MRRYRKKKTLASQKKPGTRVGIPFERVSAEVQIDSTKEVAESRVFLADLQPNGVGLFTNLPIEKGEKVTLVISHPRNLFVKGRVIGCVPYTLDRKIISQEEFNYRVNIQFVFDSPDEQANLQKFCTELNTSPTMG